MCLHYDCPVCYNNTAVAGNLTQITEERCLSRIPLWFSERIYCYHDSFLPELHPAFSRRLKVFPFPSSICALASRHPTMISAFFLLSLFNLPPEVGNVGWLKWKQSQEGFFHCGEFWVPRFHKPSQQFCYIGKAQILIWALCASAMSIWRIGPVCTVLHFFLMVEIPSLLILRDRQLLLLQVSHLRFCFQNNTFMLFTICKYSYTQL